MLSNRFEKNGPSTMVGIQCSLFSFMNFMKDDDLHESAWVFPSLLYCAYMLTVQYFEDN